jgi:hypothetical protein
MPRLCEKSRERERRRRMAAWRWRRVDWQRLNIYVIWEEMYWTVSLG